MTHEVELLDGSRATIRPVVASDEPALEALFSSMSPDSRHRRFFSLGVDLHRMARWAAHPEPGSDGLVAERDGRLVAHAVAVPLDDHGAEIAFAVAEDLHGVGLGTALLHDLARWGCAHDVGVLIAEVLPENAAMLEVLHHAAPTHDRRLDGAVEVELDPAAVCAAGATSGRTTDMRLPI